ncbi:MAG: putative lipid II flippase FtsW [Candidatus Omnitrophica bacterium CG1_02_46_14]|nr:MAG: putative lipid II flippase FtsW [Candidatus Omnitrophica bacterium CG1_02_46_14]
MEPLYRARNLLIGSAIVLLSIGIVMIYSASAIYALDRMGDSAYFIKRHLAYLAVGTALAFWTASMDYGSLRKHALPILGIAIGLMVFVLIPHIGHSTGGARRWFKVLGFSFQPSEFLKIALIFYMADYLERKKSTLNDLKHTILPALFVLGVSAGLVLKQPDLGTAMTISFVILILFFAAGFNIKYLLAIVTAALPVLIYLMLAKPYRRKRILAFFHPWDDPRGVGFQIIQSFLALGSGGIFGVGLGQSQQKLFYLPESHTDFIFSIIGEELGFIGASSVVILFIIFIFAGTVIVFHARSRFSQLLSLGLVSLISIEACINIGVSIGAMPTKGLSLPFISYGGSALLANMAALGLLVNISKELPEAAN